VRESDTLSDFLNNYTKGITMSIKQLEAAIAYALHNGNTTMALALQAALARINK
jgi:multidrug transporter EmrE-like cation transporter